jgi:hypothetical protein
MDVGKEYVTMKKARLTLTKVIEYDLDPEDFDFDDVEKTPQSMMENDLKTAKEDPQYLFFDVTLPNANEEITITGELIENGE